PVLGPGAFPCSRAPTSPICVESTCVIPRTRRESALSGSCAPRRNAKRPRTSARMPGPFPRLLGAERAQVELRDLRVDEELAPGRGVRVAALVEHVAAIADLQAPAGVLLDH